MTPSWRSATPGAVAAALLAAMIVPGAGAQTETTIQAIEGQQFSGQVATVAIDCAAASASASGTISWGDGESSPAQFHQASTSELDVTGSHAYTEEGAYAGSVSGTWSCGGGAAHSFSASFNVQVADAPLNAAGAVLSGTVGQPVSGTLATFTDADPGAAAADYRASIDWGDGSAATPGSVTAQGGGFAVGGTHVYSAAGSYTATVTVTDAGGSRATATASITIGRSAPTGAEFTLPPHIRSGEIALLNAGASNPPGAGATGYGWTIRGPGVLGGSASVTCGPGTSELQTSFTRAGSVAVTLRVTYASGAISTITHTLAVTGGRVRIVRSPNVRLSQWFLCLRGPGDPIVKVTQNGGPPPGCQDEYFVGILDVVGCLTVVNDISQVPGPEQRILTCKGYLRNGICFPAPPSGHFKLDVRHSARFSPSAFSTSAFATSGTVGGPQCIGCHRGFPSFPKFLVSTDTVRVNGLDVAPASGAAVVLDSFDGLLASSDATVSLLDGALPLASDYLRIPAFNTNGDVRLLDADLDKLKAQYPYLHQLLNLAGFQLGGTLTVDLVPSKAKIAASLTLPSSLTDLNGKTVKSTLTATADNQRGLVLDDLFVNVPSAKFGDAFEFDKLRFCYQRQIKEGFCQKQTGADFGSADSSSKPSWNATGEVNLLGVGVNASPPPPTYGLGFVDGRFAFGGAAVSFPDPGIPLGDTGVNLTSIGASLGLDPTRFTGSIGLNAADVVSIDGDLFMVFASPQSPYSFTGSELGDCCSLPTVIAQGLALAAGGDVTLDLPDPLGRQKLASGWMMFVYPDYLAADGTISAEAFGGALKLNGSVEGQFALGSGAFNVEGTIGVHAIFIDMNADAVVSSTGIGACGSVTIDWGPFGTSTASAGAGYKWGDSFPNAWLGSCDLSPYRASVSPAFDAAAQARATVRVPAGLSTEMIKLAGIGGAPDVTITGPGGIRASTAGGGRALAKPFVLYRVPPQGTTYIAIIDPPAGVYTITSNPGSPAISQVLHAQGIEPSVRARVVERRGRLRLLYAVKPEPGQRVVFFEQGRDVYRRIGATAAAHGALAFTPAPGPGGRRQILAEIFEDGAPVLLRPGAPATIVLARYRAPGPRRLGRVARLSVHHADTRVLVSFSGVRGTQRYAVTVTLSSGQHLLFLVRRRRLTVNDVPGEITGKVTVQALGDGARTRTGPATLARIPQARGR
jgi:PKD repeat protein